MTINYDHVGRDWIQGPGAEAAARAAAQSANKDQEAAATPRQLFVPGFDIGAFPNDLNRSSFIAPIARGQRKFHRQAVMITRRGCVLQYTGEQLDEADGDLIMALIAFAQPYPLGELVRLNRAELLRKLKRNTGKQQYDWLHRRLKALTEATLFVQAINRNGAPKYTIGTTVSFRIVAGISYDDESGVYCYSMDPRWVRLYGNREYSLIDWDQRMQIRRGLDMAKTLQRLVATSCNPVQRYSLSWLQAKMMYSSPRRKFRGALVAASLELERLEIIATHKIEYSTRGKEQLAMWI